MKEPVIGFIGTGVIASALIDGIFYKDDLPCQVVVSPRNAQRAAALAERYPQRLRVAASNQEVVDAADWLFLAVLPKQGEGVLSQLRLRPEQKVITLLSDQGLAKIRRLIGETALLVHMVPMAYTSQRLGPIAIYPDHAEVRALFAPLGEMIAVESEHQLSVLQAITALCCSFNNLLLGVVDFAREAGVEELAAKAYTSNFFAALCQLAAAAGPGELAEIAREATPGGLNHMAYTEINAAGAIARWPEALQPVLARLAENKGAN